MAYNTQAQPHAYDHVTIACACGHTVGYSLARSGNAPKCVKCGAVWTLKPAQAALLSPALQSFVDAWDHAAARALSGDSSVAIPRVLYEAVTEARAAVKP